MCEPPLPSRYVRIETEPDEGLNLCEVEVFGTGKNIFGISFRLAHALHRQRC